MKDADEVGEDEDDELDKEASSGRCNPLACQSFQSLL
uniref:Uncharacterized protein n=1 Tax=Nelumbo nucifera TaxID=4432 RepID=A0A822YQD7_NELNU|nr:TPA_asm: hypothetical protein HUJ06_012096 [Nelumbo nucifera]